MGAPTPPDEKPADDRVGRRGKEVEAAREGIRSLLGEAHEKDRRTAEEEDRARCGCHLEGLQTNRDRSIGGVRGDEPHPPIGDPVLLTKELVGSLMRPGNGHCAVDGKQQTVSEFNVQWLAPRRSTQPAAG